MKAQLCLLPLVSVALAGPAWAQSLSSTHGLESSCSNGNICTLGDLMTPTSPAFVLIGVSPTLVERPSTPRDVAVSLYNGVESGLPDDFALELAPYWLFPHPKLTYANYVHAGAGQQLAQNLTLSFATVSTDETALAPGFTEFSMGFRTHVFAPLTSGIDSDIDTAREARSKVRKAEETLAKLQQARLLDRALEDGNCETNRDVEPCKTLLAKRNGLGSLSSEDAAQTELAVGTKELAAAAETLQQSLDDRPGLVISLAGALSGRSPEGEASWNDPMRWALWVNGGYRDGDLDALGVFRYIRSRSMGTLELFDVGARVGGNWDRFGLFVEGLRRFVVGQPDGGMFASSNRLVGTVEVALNADLFLTGTFGQDVETATRRAGVLTLLGLSFQLARERTLSMP